jgi:hypothetical protein
MTKRTLRALLLALTGVAATAHCGKGTGESSGTTALGPTDVVVTWTLSGKPATTEACKALGAYQVSVTLSATNDPKLHQNTDVDCEKGTVTFAALDGDGLGMPFLEAALLSDKGGTLTRADMTITPLAGKTPATLDFFPLVVATTSATTGGSSVTSGGGTTSATSSGSGMGGAGGGGPASSSAAASAAATTAGAGGADAGP